MLKIQKLELPLNVNWKLSRNETGFKTNFVIYVDDIRLGGEVAPNIRYGETPELIEEQFSKITNINLENIDEYKLCHSLRFGIEAALIHNEAKKNDNEVWEFLELEKPIPAATSYSLPIMDPSLVKDYLKKIERFSVYKIKVDQDSAVDFVTEISRQTNKPLRIDANEGWRDFDEVMRFFEKIKKTNIEFIEQPMPAVGFDEEYFELKNVSPYELIADESIEAEVDFDKIEKMFHGINVKLMKTGSYYKAIRFLREARIRNMKTMVGCMIETSLGIRSAYYLSSLCNYNDLDGFLLLKDDPFKIVSEVDGEIIL